MLKKIFFLFLFIYSYSLNLSSLKINNNLGLNMKINIFNSEEINKTKNYTFNINNIFKDNLENNYKINYGIGLNIYKKIEENYSNIGIFPYLNINILNNDNTKQINFSFIPSNCYCNYLEYKLSFIFNY